MLTLYFSATYNGHAHDFKSIWFMSAPNFKRSFIVFKSYLIIAVYKVVIPFLRGIYKNS